MKADIRALADVLRAHARSCTAPGAEGFGFVTVGREVRFRGPSL
jgi:hypothetical protein